MELKDKIDTTESIREEIVTLRDDNKHLFIVLMTVFSGIFTLLYKLFIGDKNFTEGAIIFSSVSILFGFIFAFLIINTILLNRNNIDLFINNLKGKKS